MVLLLGLFLTKKIVSGVRWEGTAFLGFGALISSTFAIAMDVLVKIQRARREWILLGPVNKPRAALHAGIFQTPPSPTASA
jgi:hypothetical protein